MYILFICTGNVSRSAVAECILRTLAERAGRDDIAVASAGVQNLYGQSYDPQMIASADKYGYHMEGHSQQMTSELLQQADFIFAMEHYHYVQVQKELPMPNGTNSIKSRNIATAMSLISRSALR